MFDKADIEHINNLSTNFRSDVIAAMVVEGGVDADNIVILRRRGEARRTDKEIIDVEYKQDYEGDGRDVLLIRANRQGIYDNLPEGVFHDSRGLKENTPESIIHSFREQHEQEFFFRRFFSLFESEAECTRIGIRRIEFRYDRPDKHRTFTDTLSPLWPVVREMDARTAMLFIRMVPYIDRIRSTHSLVGRALSIITGHLVCVERESYAKASKIKTPRFGDMHLGINSILKGEISAARIKVMVTPHRENLMDLLPGRRHHNILMALLRVFGPDEVDFDIQIVPREEDYTSRLGNGGLPCIFGVNLRI